jgi:hypothetical protein
VAEALGVGVLAASLYVGCYSELPIDDTSRFTASIAAGRFEWDPAHLFMQPAAVLWHRWLGFGSALDSQHHINTFCAALSIGLFHLLLWRLRVATGVRLAMSAIAATAYNVLNLASSGHIKLTVFPFLTAALFAAQLWEVRASAGSAGRGARLLLVSGVALGVGTALLINTAVVVPFQCAAIAWTGWRRQRAGRERLRDLLTFGGSAAAAAGVLFLVGFAASSAGPWTFESFRRFLLGTPSIGAATSFPGVMETGTRLAFSSAMNFTYGGDVGAILRSWSSGDIPSLAGYGSLLLVPGLLLALTAAVVAGLHAAALVRLVRGGLGPVTPLVFSCGALLFAAAWNLNESEFYFQITLPTVLLLAWVASASTAQAVAALWLVVGLTANVALFALPKRSYPFWGYVDQLRRALAPRDLVVGFEAYPGRQFIGFFLHHVEVDYLLIDRTLRQTGDPQATLAQIEQRVNGALRGGNRVYVFGVLDERDWNAPWSRLKAMGLRKPELLRFFRERFRVQRREPMAEIPCWELHLPR